MINKKDIGNYPKIIGLTGPLGAGKDTVARILKKKGAQVIEVDQLAHTLYKPQSQLWQELVKTFGSKILKRGGEINRKKLGEIVFGDRKNLEILNKFLHPPLRELVILELERIKSGISGISCKSSVVSRRLIIINDALLKEIGILDLVDEVWVVIASLAVRLKRLLKKGMDRKTALQRMKMQMGQKDYLDIADKIIRNENSIRALSSSLLVF